MLAKDTRISVTGGEGFLGRHVVAWLERCGIENVFVPPHDEYDLREPIDAMCVALEAPDIIIHLAANVGGIQLNRERPGELLYDNAMMGLNVLHAAMQHGVEKIVVVGTVCAYPENTPVPFSEGDLWNGYPEASNAPYGLAKRLLLAQCQAYRKQYGLNAVYLLPANLYGPGDHYGPERSHVIPALIRRFVEAREKGQDRVMVWGDGTATRDFLYVEDAADGILAAALYYDEPEPVNLGTGHETSIRDLAYLIRDLTGYEGRIMWDESRPAGQKRRCLDRRRAWKYFSWRPTTSLREGLRRTIRAHEESQSMATIVGS